MAEENDSGGRLRWSLGAFLKFEAVLIAATTLVLYLQALIYVTSFCDGLGINPEKFVLSFSDVALHAWAHLASQGIVYGPIIVSILFGVPAAVAMGELFLFWMLRRWKTRKERRSGRRESREERRIAIQAEKRWLALCSAAIAMTVAFGLFQHSYHRAISSAKKEAASRLGNQTVSTVSLNNGTSRKLIFLTRLGDTYAFIRPDDKTRQHVLLSRSEVTGIEFSGSEPTTGQTQTADRS